MAINLNNTNDKDLIRSIKEISQISEILKANETLIKKGMGYKAESKQRINAFLERKLEKKPILCSASLPEINLHSIKLDYEKELERMIGPDNNILSIEFFEKGILAGSSVGRLSRGSLCGTGFHVGNSLIITNHHVIKTPEEATDSQFEINVEDNRFGTKKDQYTYFLDPKKFFLTSEEYDFTIVSAFNPDSPPLEEFGWHTLLKATGKILIGQPVNIIQHPNGNNKSVVVHDSYLLYLDDMHETLDRYCLYSSDTEVGSSGSPVFNNQWEIVAIHQRGVPKVDKNKNYLDKNGRQITDENEKVYIANQGIRISRIVNEIMKATFSEPEQSKTRDDLIKLWNEPGSHQRGLKRAGFSSAS